MMITYEYINTQIPSTFSLTPEIYGLKTEQEMLERTMVGGARADALRMAKQIVKLVRAHQ